MDLYLNVSSLSAALFQYLSSESREFTEILTIITSSYKDPASTGNFVYSKPRLVHNELLEKDVSSFTEEHFTLRFFCTGDTLDTF